MPDRTAYLLGRGESPLPRMRETARTLEKLGVSCIAVPCVTSHALYGELAAGIGVPILHMVEETAAYLEQAGIRKAGILATDGTIHSHLFQRALDRRGIGWAVPDEAGQRRVMELIYGQVKAGKPADPALLEEAARPSAGRPAAAASSWGVPNCPCSSGTTPWAAGFSTPSRCWPPPRCGNAPPPARRRSPICSRRVPPGGCDRRGIFGKECCRCAALPVF